MSDLIDRQTAINLLAWFAQHDHLGITPEQIIRWLPSEQPDIPTPTNIPTNTPTDCISRQAAIDAICTEGTRLERNGTVAMVEIKQWCVDILEELPSTQPTLYGYPVEHLAIIAEVLQKENLPPERVAEMLSDVGRIIEMARDEFEDTLRKAVDGG